MTQAFDTHPPTGVGAGTGADFRVLAIIAAYNEADVIDQVIRHLVESGVEVYLIDNGSTDGTMELARRWLGRGVVEVADLPPIPQPDGSMVVAWEEILKRKAAVAREVPADWYIHHDADEIRESPWPGLTLRDAIRWVDRLGFNAIDFRVLNFPPVDNGFEPGMDPRSHFLRWEEAAEYDRVQIKCWKRQPDAVTLHDGGHQVRFPGRRVFPVQFILRHYPVRSQEHGLRKVLQERKPRFVRRERDLGWHVQYDTVEGDDHHFLRNPASLRSFDLEQIRLEVQLAAQASDEGRPGGERPKDEVARLTGFLDRAGPEKIVGWAYDTTHPGARVAVDLFDGPHHLTTVTADLPRRDLAAAGINDGRYGFSVPVPPGMLDGRRHVVWANFAGSARSLKNSPCEFAAQAGVTASAAALGTNSGAGKPAFEPELEAVDVPAHLEAR